MNGRFVCFPSDFGDKIGEMFNERLSNFSKGEQVIIRENVDIERHAEWIADSLDDDMRKYILSPDTNIPGNFRDIRINYGEGFEKIVERTKNDVLWMQDKEWIEEWFWDAFGTLGLVYNFDTYCSEIIYGYGEN